MPYTFYPQINWPFHYLFIGFFLVSGFLFLWLNRKRRRDFDFVAGKLGLGHNDVGGEQTRLVLDRFDLFPGKDPDWVSQWTYGDYRGLPMMIFNYTFKDGIGYEDLQLMYCSAWRLPAPLPRLSVHPRGQPDPLATDLIFWDNDAFSRRYQAHGVSPEHAREIIDEEMAAVLAADDWVIEIDDDQLLIACQGEIMATELAGILERHYPLAARAVAVARGAASKEFGR